MRLEVAIFYFMVVCVAGVFIAALTGFILLQIKARPIWRLLSLAVVLVGSCWFCSFYTHLKFAVQIGLVNREIHDFAWGVDQLTAQGRTNEVRQVCRDLSEYVWTENHHEDFDKVVAHTLDLANEQPNTALQPTATAPLVSTNK
jgi:hypothetical protein